MIRERGVAGERFEERSRRRVAVRVALALVVVAIGLGVVAALGGFSSGPGSQAARPATPGPPTLAPLAAHSTIVSSGVSAVRGAWRLSASVDAGETCVRLDFASRRRPAPNVTSCVNASAASATLGVLVTAAGTVGILGIATSDVVSVKVLTSDQNEAVAPTVDGRSRFGVNFFAFPDLGISSGPSVYFGYDASGNELGRTGSRIGDTTPPPTARQTAFTPSSASK